MQSTLLPHSDRNHRSAWFALGVSAWLLAGLPAVAQTPPPSAALAASAAPADPASAAAPWPVAGRQGIVRLVVVPLNQADQREAYNAQLAALCGPTSTCFVNFFSNSTGATISMPLPDAVANEPTAIFRRSTKQGAELFRWSCRMKQPEGDCF